MEKLSNNKQARSPVIVSIVSHGHGQMVWELVEQLLSFPAISKILLTINIPELLPEFHDPRVELVHNSRPKGFGENHNAAFLKANSQVFCVLNPDIVLVDDPFPVLLEVLEHPSIGLVAPLVVGTTGALEDSMRCFLTPCSMVRRVLKLDSGAYSLQQGASNIKPDWVAGMFMLFRSDAYAKLGGFDERYFMYCEDADICTRLWEAGYKVIGCLSVSVIHNAQRASHRSFKHLSWHVRSMARYFLRHSFSLPNKDAFTQRG